MKNDILTKIFNDIEYDQLIDNIVKNEDINKDDLKQELFLSLLEKPDDLIIELYEDNRMKFYITRIIINQVYSKQSKYYYQYKKNNKEFNISLSDQDVNDFILDNYLDDSLTELDKIQSTELEKLKMNFDILEYTDKYKLLTWYEREILCLYYKLGTYKLLEGKMSMRKLEKEYGIDHCSIFNTIKIIKQKLKKHIKKNYTY